MNTSFRVLAAVVALLLGNAAADAQFLGMPRYYGGPRAHPLLGPRSLRPLRHSVPLVQVREASSSVRERSARAGAERAGPEQVGAPQEDQESFKVIDVSGKRDPQIAKALAEARSWTTGVTPQAAFGLRAGVRDPVVLRVGKDPDQRRVLKSDGDVLPRSAVHWAPLPDGLREVYRDSNRAVLIVAGEKAGRYTVHAVVLRAPAAELQPAPESLPGPKKAESKKTEAKSEEPKKKASKTEADKSDAAKPEALDPPPLVGAAPLIAENVVEFVPFVIEVAGAAPDVVTPVPAVAPDKGEVLSTAPIPLDGFSVLFIVGKRFEEQMKMPWPQKLMVDDPRIKTYLDRTCVKVAGQPAWRNYDPTAAVTEEPWKTAMGRRRTSVPWIIISNGKTGFEGPLPGARAATPDQAVEELLELLRKYGG
jgi:hypothetical protein